MKKISALLLAILMLLVQASVIAEQNIPQAELVVGNPTPMRGDFFTDMFGNNGTDADVRDLLHGYNLVVWDYAKAMFTVDPSVVRSVQVTDNARGDRSYTMTLQDDLYYSDGVKIDAWDYAFTYLLQIAPQIAQIGGTPVRTEHLAGYQDYVDGKVNYLSGVRVLADNKLMVTVSHEYLPFYYEYGLIMCNPYPVHVIAPGVAVYDNGLGTYLANADFDTGEPVFTADLLRGTILDPATGYLSHPSVVSGPYTLKSWDGTTAAFEANPYYKGDRDGKKPAVSSLVYTCADYADMMVKLQSGEFGLLNKVVRANAIRDGAALVQLGGFDASSYPRAGLSFISFNCERPTVGSQAVRQAIAWCFDRDLTAAEYTGNFGQSVDGYFGLGQWMYGVIAGTVQVPATATAYDSMNLSGLTHYTVDTARAASLLDSDGWQLNDAGIRAKDINGTSVVLDLVLAYPEGNTIADQMNKYLVPNLQSVGIRLTLQPVPMSDLLTAYYKQGESRDMDMIYMATNFDLVFDPSVHFQLDPTGEYNWAYTNQADSRLYQLAQDMRQTRPEDTAGYCRKWIAFQERFNTVLPMLPVYSNMYYDFYTSDLQDYDIASAITWSQAIIDAKLQ